MDALIAGYHRFRESAWPERRRAYENLAEHGQRPETMIIGCVDSRVDPAVIFDAAPGELLTVRNVANLVPPYAPDVGCHGTSAAIEFGVKVLGVEHIVVLGHGLCGGVAALLQGPPADVSDFIPPWISIAEPAKARALARAHEGDHHDLQSCCEQEVIRTSLSNLMTFPWIASAVAAGRLRLHGAWFAIYTGELMVLDAQGQFTTA